ncbi:MAG: transketolase [Bacilli bacterium]|nr:transketolase [Bacilli bacterium]MDD4607879.1 transketolase [Bacilli bacterium]
MENRIINNIKALGIDMISEAGSGHPGIVLGAASILYTLYSRHMNVSLNDSNWINRDRFVMSAGHGSALLYATLFMAGFDIKLDDLRKFRRAGSITPGHPEVGVTPGVDMSTGPLGQGFASAVGMALGEKILEERTKFPQKGKDVSLINYHVYCLASDGDLMEGISYEAASFAGTLNLDNLIVLYDSNNVSLDGDTSNTFIENVCGRFQAMGWYTDTVKNVSNVYEIDKAIEKAKKAGKPALIEFKTTIGEGSFLAGTHEVHGKVLEKDDIENIKRKLNMPNESFNYENDAMNVFKNMVIERGARKYEIWSRKYDDYVNEVLGGDKSKINYLFDSRTPIDLTKEDWQFETNVKEATRVSNGYIMNKIAALIPNFIGGSADLSSSTKTYLRDFLDIADNHYEGRNIWFGVREHAMGAILNGLALTNFRVFGSTFLSFADYVKPAIRLSALMSLPVSYIFTHDAINIGQDGPTHQPVEQLAMLRSTPGLLVYRPADAREIVGCWNCMLNMNLPASLVLSRNEVPLLDRSSITNVIKGGYIVRKETTRLRGVIIATGSEVNTAINVANTLMRERNMDIRVVSMPCMELFLVQDESYRNEILPVGVKVVVIEAGSSFGWDQFVYNRNYLITVDNFGISGTKDEVLRYCNFDFETIKSRVEGLLK